MGIGRIQSHINHHSEFWISTSFLHPKMPNLRDNSSQLFFFVISLPTASLTVTASGYGIARRHLQKPPMQQFKVIQGGNASLISPVARDSIELSEAYISKKIIGSHHHILRGQSYSASRNGRYAKVLSSGQSRHQTLDMQGSSRRQLMEKRRHLQDHSAVSVLTQLGGGYKWRTFSVQQPVKQPGHGDGGIDGDGGGLDLNMPAQLEGDSTYSAAAYSSGKAPDLRLGS